MEIKREKSLVITLKGDEITDFMEGIKKIIKSDTTPGFLKPYFGLSAGEVKILKEIIYK